MPSITNKRLQFIVFVGIFFTFLMISTLRSRPSVGAPLLQNVQTPAAYLPMILNGQSSTNQSPSVNAGLDQTVTLPGNALLDGAVTDDGLPNPPRQISTLWSKISGSGTVAFVDPNTAHTNAIFSQADVYVLRLTASDGALTAFDELTITVSPAPISNQAPNVNAGTDQAVTLPNNVMLDGTVTDDGLPNPPGNLSTSWSQISGPGTVTFANLNALDTSVTFSEAGVYVLRLTATDSKLNTFDELTITVSPAPVLNQVPTINAGVAQTITLPNNAMLDGTMTDDGLPNPPAHVTTTWSKTSGPGAVTFADPNTVDTAATFSQAGDYILQLTANDGELNTFDEVTITVNPAASIDGLWQGTTSQGKQISFRVRDHGFVFVSVDYFFDFGSCSLSGPVFFFQAQPIPIYGDTFSVAVSAHTTASGTFDSATAASGTFHVQINQPGCSGANSATWTATKQ